MRRMVEIVTSGPPSPYIVHEEGETEINFIPLYESIEKIVEKLIKLIEFSESKSYSDN
jgi:hypothetical protein